MSESSLPQGFVQARQREQSHTGVRVPERELPDTEAAMIVLGPDGAVIHSSALARQLFAEYCPGEADDSAFPQQVVSWQRGNDAELSSALTISAPWGRLRVRALSGRTPEGWRLLLLDDQRTSAMPSLKSLRALGLTDRQAQVLRLLACGHGTQKIADHLYLSPATVRKHLENIYERVGVKSRTEAVALALQQH